MSRLTGSDVRSMMEAYNAVYAPQELTEEQVWEEVENWVNSLLEEGYDLSEYTWEEMYESYLEERRSRKGLSPEVRQERQAQDNVRRAQAPTTPPRSGGGRVGRGQRARAAADSGAGGDAAYRAGGGDAAARSGRSRQEIQAAGMAAVRAKPAATPAAAAPRPAAPAAAAPRPAAPAAAAPRPAATPAATPTAAPKPAATPAATSSSTTPARPSLSSQTADLRQMRARSLERQSKPLSAATVSASTKPAFQANSFDPFDVVIGHLLDEGYADTEEAAIAIMSNMSEEWRNSIVEETLTEKLKKGTKGVQFGSGRHSGGWEQAMTEKNPKTGRQRATSPMLKAMGAHGKARSAQEKAEREGDFAGAEKNRQRREKIAATVYRKTNKIIDRADND